MDTNGNELTGQIKDNLTSEGYVSFVNRIRSIYRI